MKPLSKIYYDKSFFQGKKIILWGCGYFGKKILSLYRLFGIEPYAFCDSNPEKVGKKIEGLNVLSIPQLVEENKDHTVVLQVACSNVGKTEILAQANTMNFSTIFTPEETIQVLSAYHRFSLMKRNPSLQIKEEKRLEALRYDEFIKFQEYYLFSDHPIFLCMAGKTADVSILHTMKHNHIPVHFTHHTPFAIDLPLVQSENKKIKIITGVRDPFSQKISGLYQGFSHLYRHHFLWDKPIEVLDRFFNSNMSDISYLFAETDYWNYSDFFMEEYKEQILDYTKYPFDREKGYGIIKEGNLEIFFYQLEKLNHIIPKLADFVGGTFTELQNENEASSKWIAESYEDAKKELKVPRDVFESFYQADWVEHFYSPEDIAKFKARWEKNVQKED